MTPEPKRGAGTASDYYYRRALTLPELLPAIGAAVGIGAAAFYVARILLQRTPLVPMRDIPTLGPTRQRKPQSAEEARASIGRPRKGSTRSLPSLAPPPTITRRNARRVDVG